MFKRKIQKLSSENILYRYPCKCVLLGDSGVGKTTFLELFTTTKDWLDINLTSTIGVGFSSKTITLDQKATRQEIILQLWDTAGSERFAKLVKSYLREVDIAIFVCSINDYKSFKALHWWKEQLDEMNTDDRFYIPVIIVTKDDSLRKTVKYEEIIDLALQWNCEYYIGCFNDRNSKHLTDQIMTRIANRFDKEIKKLFSHEPESLDKKFKYLSKNNVVDLTTDEQKTPCCF